MRLVKFLFCIGVCCVVLDITLLVHARCVCNAKGTDYCHGCTEGPGIVRPKPKYYDTNPDINLNPIGDNCWCSKLLIEPAALPKPCPKENPKPPKPGAPCKCPKKPTYVHNPPPSYSYNPPPPTYSYPEPNYIPKEYNKEYTKEYAKDYSLPADPISISLAAQIDKAIAVPEAKLSYGYVGKPVEAPKIIYTADVPEENLFKLKSEVITLKKPVAYPKKEEEEEPVEEEPEEPEGYAYDDERPHLTYKQLGYVTEYWKNPVFRKVASGPSYVYDYDHDYKTSYASPSYGPPPSDCGFKPGRIIPYRKKACEVDGKPSASCSSPY